MTWDVPVKDNCPICGQTMFKLSGRGFKRPFCINPECSNFLPEDKRGGYKKKADAKGAGFFDLVQSHHAEAGRTGGRDLVQSPLNGFAHGVVPPKACLIQNPTIFGEKVKGGFSLKSTYNFPPYAPYYL